MHSVQGSTQSPHLRQTRKAAVSRRSVVTSALAVPFLPRFAQAAEITWRVAHNAPTDFPIHVRLVETAGAIAIRSEGQMAVEIYANSELGSPVGLLAQLRAGTIDAVPMPGQMLARDLAVAALPMVGFAFSGYDHLWPAIDGNAGGFVRSQITERLGLVPMDKCWDFGFRQITTSRKHIGNAADIEGLRIRTQPEADFIQLLQALKALPVATPLNGLAAALSTHAVDGQEGVMPLVKAAGLYKVQSVCALTNHVWDGHWLCISNKSWSKLPDRLKEIVSSALNESALLQRQDIAAAEAKIRTELEAADMTFNTVDQASFRAVLAKSGYYAAWHKRMGNDAWTALEKYTGSLT